MNVWEEQVVPRMALLASRMGGSLEVPVPGPTGSSRPGARPTGSLPCREGNPCVSRECKPGHREPAEPGQTRCKASACGADCCAKAFGVTAQLPRDGQHRGPHPPPGPGNDHAWGPCPDFRASPPVPGTPEDCESVNPCTISHASATLLPYKKQRRKGEGGEREKVSLPFSPSSFLPCSLASSTLLLVLRYHSESQEPAPSGVRRDLQHPEDRKVDQ